MSPKAFCARWPDSQREAVQLLDVRAPAERILACIPGSIDIPMSEIPSRLAELDRAKPIVVLCHSGARSGHVAAFLIANGFEPVFNLDGGIDAWAADVDLELPRY